MAGEGGNMVSRAVPSLSENPKTLAIQVKQILEDHRRDIKNLFEMTTDTDLQEQNRRDNS